MPALVNDGVVLRGAIEVTVLSKTVVDKDRKVPLLEFSVIVVYSVD